MCGIFLVASARKPIDRQRFHSALRTMEHRGPDAFCEDFQEIDQQGRQTFIGLGHTRLSIIDIDPRANQPFTDTETALTFNGEIYNFRELKAEISGGAPFRTTSDTEVLHRLLSKHGTSALPRLNGQWAFAHVDKKARKITVSRDRFGKKPLFYFASADLFIVSSNIKAICGYLGCSFRLDPQYLESFLVFGTAPLAGEQTPYLAIRQLPPGFFGIFDLDEFALTTGRYFDFDKLQRPQPDQCALRQLLEDAVSVRLTSDRPVGLMLSGGIDSSLILAVLKKLEHSQMLTCFIGDTSISADAKYAQEAASTLGIDPHVISIRYDSVAFEQFMDLVKHQERPFELVGNLLAMSQMYRGISNTDIKVVLDGTGADEIFGGYWDRYFPYALREGLRERSLGWLVQSISGNFPELRRLAAAVKFAQTPASARAEKTLTGFLPEMSLRARSTDPLIDPGLRYTDAKRLDATMGRLQDWLWQNDRNSMSIGIEARSPFMDVNLAPYMMCGYKENFSGGYNKLQLRRQFDNFFPLPTQWRKQKQGFRWSPTHFMNANRSKIYSCISGSSIVSELLGKNANMIIDLMKNNKIPDGRFLQRIFSISALEDSLGAKI